MCVRARVCVCVCFLCHCKEAKRRGTWLSSQGVDSTGVISVPFKRRAQSHKKETNPKDEPYV